MSDELEEPRPALRRGTPAPPRTRPTPPPVPSHRGLLDTHRWRRWEDTLTGPEAEAWRKINALLDGASNEFQSALLNKIITTRLETARKRGSQAREDGEAFRADLIERNIPAYTGQVEQLDKALDRSLSAIAALDAADEELSLARNHLKASWAALDSQGIQLAAVSLPWAGQWPGVERGRGITGYDTPAGVKRVAEEVAAACERRHKPKADPTPAQPVATPPQPRKTGGLF